MFIKIKANQKDEVIFKLQEKCNSKFLSEMSWNVFKDDADDIVISKEHRGVKNII